MIMWADIFPNPGHIGQSEYRAIHDCILDALEKDRLDDVTKEDLMRVVDMLDEFEQWAKKLKDQANKFAPRAYQ